jgi:DNA (cytosine-5)-methyltransferase 1
VRLTAATACVTFGSVCSGIEAASVAFAPLGWRAAWFAEIEPFPSALLAHRYPDVPNLGDMTTIAERVHAGTVPAPDVLCGGTPCQSFSVAGLRRSLDDERGNLTLAFVELADAIDDVRRAGGEPAAIVLWENVPGVLSTDDNAFGCFLGALAGCDAAIVSPSGWTDAGVVAGPRRAVAWRVLDAQYFGLAQRRRRVFVVASAREGFDPAAVLLEFDGVRRDSAPRREAGEGVAGSLRAGSGGGCGPDADDAKRGVLVAFGGNRTSGPIDVATALLAQPGSGWKGDFESETFVTHTLRGESFDASEDGTGRGAPLVVTPFDTTQITSGGNYSAPQPGDPRHPLAAGAHSPAIAFNARQDPINGPINGPIDCDGASSGVMHGVTVRRLTPRECERLQGFHDDYTLIPWRGRPADECPDGPRYRALGNSWAVPCASWIGARIDAAMSPGRSK